MVWCRCLDGHLKIAIRNVYDVEVDCQPFSSDRLQIYRHAFTFIYIRQYKCKIK